MIGHLKAVAGTDSLEVKIEGEENLLEALNKLPSEVRRHVIDEKSGKIVSGTLILVNGADVRREEAERIKVKNEDTVSLIPAIHGG